MCQELLSLAWVEVVESWDPQKKSEKRKPCWERKSSVLFEKFRSAIMVDCDFNLQGFPIDLDSETFKTAHLSYFQSKGEVYIK